MTRRARFVAASVVVALGAALGLRSWLLRDPVPHFDERRGRLSAIDEGTTVDSLGTRETHVRVSSTSGLHVELAIRRPSLSAEDSGQVRRPLFLILGGHERGKGAGALIGDTRGAIFASMEYPFEGNHRAKGLAVLAQVPAIRRALYDTPPAAQIALDYLLTRPDVDPSRVELVGASFGAPFATIVAARDRRVTRLWLAHGGGDTHAMIDRGLEKEIGNDVLRAPVSHLANLLASGPRFTPERWVAQVAPRPIVMLNAEDDEKIPRRSVEVLFAAAQAPKELVWLPGNHMQGNRPEVLQRLIDAIITRAQLDVAPAKPPAEGVSVRPRPSSAVARRD
jgi:dienelactone hydrolase